MTIAAAFVSVDTLITLETVITRYCVGRNAVRPTPVRLNPKARAPAIKLDDEEYLDLIAATALVSQLEATQSIGPFSSIMARTHLTATYNAFMLRVRNDEGLHDKLIDADERHVKGSGYTVKDSNKAYVRFAIALNFASQSGKDVWGAEIKSLLSFLDHSIGIGAKLIEFTETIGRGSLPILAALPNYQGL